MRFYKQTSYIYVATEAGFGFAQQYFHNKSYLVTSNDMNNHKHVSNCNKPDGLLKWHEDIILNSISKHPITNQGNRKIAQGYHDICDDYAFPHGFLGGLFGCGRYGCLDLQDHIMPSIGKSYITQCWKEVEHISCCGWCLGTIVHIWLNSPVSWSCPSNGRVTVEQLVPDCQ